MRYIVKHYTEFNRTSPEILMYHTHGHQWFVWDSEVATTVNSTKSESASERIASDYNDSEDE